MKELTIIIPCLNEEKFIEKTINSIINSDFNKDKLEVLIYDGNSEDNSVKIIKNYTKKYEYINLRVNEKRIAPVAFNKGIQEADTEFIMILGAHSEVATNYFTECTDFLKKNKSFDVVGGVLKNRGDDEVSMAIAKAMSSPFGVGGAHFRTGRKSGEVSTVAFGVYRKSIFEKLGLFNEQLIRGQDGEMNHRIKRNGGKIYLLTDTYVTYFVRSTFKKLFKQYFQYGQWKLVLNVVNKSFVSVRQLVPSIFVAILIFSLISIFISDKLFILSIPIVIIYLLLALYMSIKLSKSIVSAIYLLISFVVLHVSYGIGYFYGIYKILFK